jgi:hypothetical protein
MGYAQSEIDAVQEYWKLRFPPDLVDLLLVRRPLVAGGFDWLDTPVHVISQMVNWPFEGWWFDVKENGLWWPEWGQKPKSSTAQMACLAEVFARAPKLIPLYGHRYLPETPQESGNPVFSVHQSDVVIYGTNLSDWITREERGWEFGQPLDRDKPLREIQFWSEAARRN